MAKHNHGHEHSPACTCAHEGSSCGCSHEHGEGGTKGEIIKLIISAALTLALICFKSQITAVSPLLFGALFAVPYLISGLEVLLSAAKNILKGKIFDEQFLMAIATLGAFAIGEYAEAVAVMIFYNIGELFEHFAVDRSHRSIAKAMDLRPDSACVLRGGEKLILHPSEIEIGETVLVKPGEKIALDGVIKSGQTSLDTSALTGEAAPKFAQRGDRVLSGCVNLSGLIEIEVEKPFSESTVAKILELVESSSAKKAKAENFITKFARYYTPAVVIAAALLFAIPSIIVGNPREWLGRALVFLVVSCPCALVVSIPLSFFGGIGGAARQGILIKGSNYIDTLSKTQTALFDKTGTLTQGKFKVAEIHANGISEAELLALAAAAESASNHPIAKSICEACNAKALCAEEVEEIAGMGVIAQIGGRKIAAGNKKLMDLVGAEVAHNSCGGAAVHLAEGEKYLGTIVVRDEIKPDSSAAISALKALKIKTAMLTGDSEPCANAVAKEIGIDEHFSSLLPADKVAKAEDLLSGGTLAFIGDGINDAPVLARADIGFAMGADGSDAAIEAADIVIMDDSPAKVALAVKIAKKTMKIVRQNIVFALGIKLAVLLFSAFGAANMWVAVFADVGVTVLAVLNAMRAMKAPK